ncbi:hypothetical protein JR334_07720 [Clostridia bacterium]|nr:hypothetical protein JR334_07720 [Clostridia bacterium]
MLVKFTNHGYSYTDVDGTSFYDEDKEHKGLFDFLDADLSSLPKILESYISKIIDKETFKLTGYEPSYNDLRDVDYVLDYIHPYFEINSSEEINNAIADYFNALLLQRSYSEDDYTYSPIYDEKWYMETLSALLKDCYYENEKEKHIKSFYENYLSIVKPDDDADLPPYIELPPKGFSGLISLQDHLRSMVFWMLDASALYLNELSISERVWVYGNVHSTISDMPHMTVTKQISFTDPHRNSLGYSFNFHDFLDGISDSSTLYGNLMNFHNNQEDVRPKAVDTLKSIIERAKMGYSEGIYEEYKVDSLFEVLFLEIYYMILEQVLVKKCRNCGKYFVLKNKNVEYCNRLIDEYDDNTDDRTCSDVGPKLSYQKKLEADQPLKSYSRAYKTHYARIKSGKLTKPGFFEWQQEAKEKLEQVRSGEYDLEDYKKWLKN